MVECKKKKHFVFYNNAEKKVFKKLAVTRYAVGNEIQAAWDMQRFPDQWDALKNIIETYQPKKIAINSSENFGHADGLDYT
ncbi:hypothetical protein, partial [Salmonella enterica]|uniref:hypothetical protein n=1 Tax=Salmonella enterica TaxID=28901 RepID=UPI001910B584